MYQARVNIVLIIDGSPSEDRDGVTTHPEFEIVLSVATVVAWMENISIDNLETLGKRS